MYDVNGNFVKQGLLTKGLQLNGFHPSFILRFGRL